ncbi:MAG: sulfatase-like hydrolase/transferase [Candidatus Hydrogenedentes bacterium]|nr:sulfatase-like hydrolase/transferase [Candidatus Hydrogenedentota bacterium]
MISRRNFIQYGSAALASVLTASQSAARPVRKPDVVFVLADDLRADGFASLGNGVVKTPNFDAIVNRGLRFHKAYTMGSMTGAVCLPSRTMLLTGRSLFRATDTASGAGRDTYTFPRAMKAAGYATLHAGKFGNSPKKITDEFDETSDPGQSTEVANAVIGFVQRRQQNEPVFIYMAGPDPHDPQFAPASFYAQYRPEDIPLPAAFAPYQPFDNGEMAVRDEMTLPWPRTPADVRGKLARYYASISYLDAEFGRVVQALKDAGRYDNTIFVIAGDNGLSLGEHGLLGKQNLYEFGGMHVPLVFAGPGIPRGETDALAYLMDVFPTVCELSGARIPGAVEGSSLVPVIRGGRRRVREWLYTAYSHGQRAVTDGRWKLIRYPLIDKTQLFDLRADSHEAIDLSSRPEQARRVKAMLKQLARLQREYGDSDPLTVAEPLRPGWTPAHLTADQIRYQAEETARCKGLAR